MTNTTAQQASETTGAGERLAALVALNQHFASERDPVQLLERFCDSARTVLGAEHAIVGIIDAGGSTLRYLMTSGMDAETVARLGSLGPRFEARGTVMELRRCLRAHHSSGAPTAMDLSSASLRVQSWLGAPIVSLTRTYGWLDLINKSGAATFTDEDERIAGILAAQLGRIYENGSLYADLKRRAAELEREVFDREQTERALIESESRKAAILETSLDAIVSIDQRGLIREFNPAAEAMFGYRRADVLDKEIAELIVPPSLREQYRRELARFLASGDSDILGKRIELTGLRANGAEFPIELGVTHFRVHDEPMFTCTIRDIQDRKHSENALREREEQVRLLLDSTAEAIYGLDMEGRCTICNPACARMLGYASPSDLLGKRMHELIHYKGPDGKPCPIEKCSIYQAFQRRQGTHADDEVFWRADGTSFPVEYWSYPVMRGDIVLGAVVTFLDITERKKLEDQFRQAQKMEAVGRLAGGVAHDFNNLLTVIIGYGEVALATLRPGDPLRDLISPIKAAGERAASLTRQLLAFSRKQVLAPVVLDVNALLADMAKMLPRLIGEDIDLMISQAPKLSPVLADAGQLEQVIMNLVVNARDAMPQGGKLTIETANVKLDESYRRDHPNSPIGEFVLVAVNDTGCGMDEATQSRIFEPFFTTKGPEKGTGLGLATVWGIVIQSGGYIEVYSEVGLGTTFKVYLPRTGEQAGASKSHPAIAQPVQGTETILLVEDEAEVRALARLVLQSHGYRVLEAQSGAEALLIAQRHHGPIDLLVSDVVMPNMSGRRLAERMEIVRPELKVLYLSGYTDDAIVHHGITDDDAPFLQKPFSPLTLARKVRQLLDAGKQSRHE
jgi:PAS domain S-box-containing protein